MNDTNKPTTEAMIADLKADIENHKAKFTAIAGRAVARGAARAQEHRKQAAKHRKQAAMHRSRAEGHRQGGRPVEAAKADAAQHRELQAALEELQAALEEIAEAIAIADDWKLPVPEWMDTSPRWQIATTHRGVGEGDEGGARIIDHLRLADLTDAELESLDLGLKMSCMGSIRRSWDDSSLFTLFDEDGNFQQVGSGTNVEAVWAVATARHTDEGRTPPAKASDAITALQGD